MHRHLQLKVPRTTYHKLNRPCDQPGDKTTQRIAPSVSLLPKGPPFYKSHGRPCLFVLQELVCSILDQWTLGFKGLAGTVLTEVKQSETP